MWDLVGNHEDRFSHNEAQLLLYRSVNSMLSRDEVQLTLNTTHALNFEI